MKSFNLIEILLIFILLNSLNIFSQEKVESLIGNPPVIKSYVTDETGTLTDEQVESLSLKLKRFFDSTSTQIVVYMLNTLNGEPIEDVSIEIARKNKIGTSGNNNGVLLLIAKDDHKLRIEVGYGLEGLLTDAISTQIINKEIAPQFKKNEFYEGISRGVNEIILIVEVERFFKKNRIEKESSSSKDYVIIMVVSVIGLIGIIGLIRLIFVMFFSKSSYVNGSSVIYNTGHTSSYSGFSSSSGSYSSSSSSSGSSSSSSSSGFSGGGGDFGGGGASGSW